MADIPNVNLESRTDTVMDAPDRSVKVREAFGIDSDMEVPAFSEADERVPDLDPAYVFDPDTTLAICAGFARNRRVMVQGYHGTGKSTHIEQVAARLNWPLIRINLDAHISRIDLIGRDAIVLREGQQVTEFREGLLPWALQTPTALGGHEFQDWPPHHIAGGFGGDLQARRHDHTHLATEFTHNHPELQRDAVHEGERAFDRLNPEFGVPADQTSHYGRQAVRDREAALALGVRVAVHDSRQNDPNPVIWQPGQDYRMAEAIHTARRELIRTRHGPERTGSER